MPSFPDEPEGPSIMASFVVIGFFGIGIASEIL